MSEYNISLYLSMIFYDNIIKFHMIPPYFYAQYKIGDWTRQGLHQLHQLHQLQRHRDLGYHMASIWLLCSVCTRTLEVGDIKKCRHFFFENSKL